MFKQLHNLVEYKIINTQSLIDEVKTYCEILKQSHFDYLKVRV